MKSASATWGVAAFVLMACDSPGGSTPVDGSPADVAAEDAAPMADDARDDLHPPAADVDDESSALDVRMDAERDVADGGFDLGPEMPGCDPSAHVDCFFSVACLGGTVRQSAHAPYYCCDERSCRRAIDDGICWVGRHECPTRACDPRWLRCDQRYLYAEWNRRGQRLDLSVFCVGGGHRPGERCGTDDDCVPQVEGAPGRLRCDRDGGTCAPGPRPSVAAGGACLWDDDCGEGLRCACAPVGEGRCEAAADGGAPDAADGIGADR